MYMYLNTFAALSCLVLKQLKWNRCRPVGQVHHTPPHDDEYCLLGVTTWPVTWLGRAGLGSIFWIALFLVLTAFDTVYSAKLLSAIFA